MDPTLNTSKKEDISPLLFTTEEAYISEPQLMEGRYEVNFDLSKLRRTGESKGMESGEGTDAVAIRGTTSVPVYIMFPPEVLAEFDESDLESIRRFILTSPDLLSNLINVVNEEDPAVKAQMLSKIRDGFKRDLFLDDAKIVDMLDEVEIGNYQTREFIFEIPAMLKAIIPKDEKVLEMSEEDKIIINNILARFENLQEIMKYIDGYNIRVRLDKDLPLEEFWDIIGLDPSKRLTNSEIEFMTEYIQAKVDLEMENQVKRYLIQGWESRVLKKLKGVGGVIKPIDRVTITMDGKMIPATITLFIEGLTLDQANTSVRQLLSSHAALRLAQIIDDVHAAGVIHRDIKPNNIVLDIYKPSLIDFGAGWMPDYVGRIDMPLNNTPPYSAPENIYLANSKFFPSEIMDQEGYVGRQITEAEHEDAKGIMKSLKVGHDSYISYSHTVDIYALAKTFMILEGWDPWDPKIAKEVYAKATDLDPEKRYQTAREFIYDLMKAYGTGGLSPAT